VDADCCGLAAGGGVLARGALTGDGVGRGGLGWATGGGAAITATVNGRVLEGMRQDCTIVIDTGPRCNCTSTVSPSATVALGDPSIFSSAAAPSPLVSRILVSAPTVMFEVSGFESQSSPATPAELNVTSAPGAAKAVLAIGIPANAPTAATVANRLSISLLPGQALQALGLTEY
jgi:hypothetical protein